MSFQWREVLLGNQPLKRVEEFKHMRSVFHSNGDVDADVNHRFRAEWTNAERSVRSFVINESLSG